MYPSIILKKKREQSVKRFHPWIFSGAIHYTPNNIAEGDLVEILDYDGNFLAIGHYQPDTISVRILTYIKEKIDTQFFIKKIQSSYNLRKTLFQNNKYKTNVYRLVHGEGDFLPGLIIENYNGLVVIQCHSAGMFRSLNLIVEALGYVFNNNIVAIYNKSSTTLPPKFQVNKEDGFLLNNHDSPIEVLENNYSFLIDFIYGQKTGFFIDQRENRKLLTYYCNNKSVANLYGYTGGFSVYAAKNGAKQVITVDSSAKALAIAEKNYQLNNLYNIENVEMDVMEFFKTNNKNYDIVILDPPAFAKHHIHKSKALIAYKQVNAKALKILNSGGLLFSFSCSQAITANELRQAIFVAAANEKKSLRLLHSLHQPPDHPISIFHPEGEYLKGFVFQVE